MRTKDGSVNITDLEQVVKDALPLIETARAKAYQVVASGEMVVTSGKDGKHGANSLHYKGRAVDLRTRDVIDMWAHYLRNALGKDWDVVIEPGDTMKCPKCSQIIPVPALHLHAEYDPK